MKVLWFTNTPSGAGRRIKSKTQKGGWLNALEAEIEKIDYIDLAICFYSNSEIRQFSYSKTVYYPVTRRYSKTKLLRYFGRLVRSLIDIESDEIRQLSSIVQDFQPDIIHIHGTEQNFGLLCNHTNVPIVISLQGILNAISEKFYAGVPREIAKKKNDLWSRVSLRSATAIHKTMKKNAVREKKILAQTKNIIGRTDWDRRVSKLLAPTRSYFIVNEILRKPFYSNEWQRNRYGDEINIITVTSGAMYKGVETILKTAYLLREYQFRFKWKIIGLEKSSQVLVILKRWLHIDLDDLEISFLGVLNEYEIVKKLIEADIYCQTSHIENSPNSLCEAMILGLPIIASYAGGTSSLISDRDEGILVPNGDSHSLAGAIIELSQDYELACRFSVNARKHALSRHNPKKIVNELLSTYNSILGD